jgi:hypothetical protein
MQQQNDAATAMSTNRTLAEIEEIVALVRLHLYNRGLPCGPETINKYLVDEYAINPLPSNQTIARILSRQGLTKQRTGNYNEWKIRYYWKWRLTVTLDPPNFLTYKTMQDNFQDKFGRSGVSGWNEPRSLSDKSTLVGKGLPELPIFEKRSIFPKFPLQIWFGEFWNRHQVS